MLNPEVPKSLLPVSVSKSKAQLYSPGKYLVFTKSETDLTIPYSASDLKVSRVDSPILNPAMEKVWKTRYAEQFPNGLDWDNGFPGMLAPQQTLGSLHLPLFESGYLDWRLALPWGDKYDAKLSRKCLRPYFNIHHVPVTRDGFLLYGRRHPKRMIWQNNVFCTHSWGDDVDKKGVCSRVMLDLEKDEGEALFRQAAEGVRRELNPVCNSHSPFTANTVLEEIVATGKVTVSSASALLLHIQPRDFGYHLGFTAHVDMDAEELLRRRNAYPYETRLGSLNAVKFTPGSMAQFFVTHQNQIAPTIEGALIMTAVQEFGESFLDELSAYGLERPCKANSSLSRVQKVASVSYK
jgi:hypothetical protein